MSAHRNNFTFTPNFNFATDSFFTNDVFSLKNPELGAPFPPAPGNFLLLDGTQFLLLNDGTDLLLL